MRHNHVINNNRGDHWAVGSSGDFLPGEQAWVLVQLQERGEQVRVPMSAEQAEDMAAALLKHAAKVREAQPIILTREEILELSPKAQANYREALRAQLTGEKPNFK